MIHSNRLRLKLTTTYLPLVACSILLTSCLKVDQRPSNSNKTATLSVQSYIAQIDDRPSVNAFIHIDRTGALAAAARLDADSNSALPLRGHVIAVKDNIHVAGMPNTAGTLTLAQFTPTESSPVVEKLEAAGAIVLGKTNMHELAYGVTSNNFAYGPVRNPIDETRIPGGSSGGSAAAVAGDMATAAIGTDTGASVRLPAALTGIVGFRPTVGRYSLDHVTVISPTRDTLGFMAKTVAEVDLLDRITTNRNEAVQLTEFSSLRIGVPRKYFFENLDPDVATTSNDVIAYLKAQGAQIVEADLIGLPKLNAKVGFPIVLYETVKAVALYLKTHAIGISPEELLAGVKSPDVKGILTAAYDNPIPEAVYLDALNIQRPLLQNIYRNYFTEHDVDVVIFPTSPVTARNIKGILDGVIVNGDKKDAFLIYTQNTDPGSNAGLPGISIPMGFDSYGLPIGLEIDGPEGSDIKLLSIALTLENALQNRLSD